MGRSAPKGSRNGNYRHGDFTCETIAHRREMAAWVRALALEAKKLAA
jgi:hypothetical protein